MNCWLLAEPFEVPQLYRTFKTFERAHRWATKLLYTSTHWHWQNDGSLLGYFANDAGQCLVFRPDFVPAQHVNGLYRVSAALCGCDVCVPIMTAQEVVS